MSCNIRIPLQQIIDDVAAALSDGFIKTDNAVLNEAVLNNVTFRGDITTDTAARDALCRILQTCGITAIELEWLDRPTVSGAVAVSKTGVSGVEVVWQVLTDILKAENISTVGGETQEEKNAEFSSAFAALPELIEGKISSKDVTHTPQILGGVARNQESVNSDSINIMDFHDTANGDDYTDAFYAALNAYPEKSGFRINIPAGVFKLTKPLYLVRRIELCGEGIGVTTLDFSGITTMSNPPYSAAIIIAHSLNIRGKPGATAPNTLIVPESQLVTTGIDSKITNMTIKGQGKTNPTNFNGVVVNAPANLEKVEVTQFSGHGFWLTAGVNDAGYGGGYEYSGIANHSEFSYCQAFNNGKDGIRITGSDANTFYIRQCLLAANGGWGIFDHSLLGGVVSGCEVDSSGVGAYGGSGGTGTGIPSTPTRTVWIGNYSEGNASPVHYAVGGRSIILGYTGGGPTEQNYLGAVSDTGFIMQKSLNIASSDLPAFEIGGTTERASRLSRGALALRTQPSKALFEIKTYDNENATQFCVDNLPVINITILEGAAGSFNKLGSVRFPQGIFLGSGMGNITTGGAAPTTEDRYRGDVVYNTDPVAGGFIGWVCVADGTPGTWKGFGKIGDAITVYPTTGATEARPTAPPIGHQYFDTTLGKPVYFKSAGVWVDATGAIV